MKIINIINDLFLNLCRKAFNEIINWDLVVCGALAAIIGFVWFQDSFDSIFSGQDITEIKILLILLSVVILMTSSFCVIRNIFVSEVTKIIIILAYTVFSFLGLKNNDSFGLKMKIIAMVGLIAVIIIVFADLIAMFIGSLIWAIIILTILIPTKCFESSEYLNLASYIVITLYLVTFNYVGPPFAHFLLGIIIGKNSYTEDYMPNVFREQMKLLYLVFFVVFNVFTYLKIADLSVFNNGALTWLAMISIKWEQVSIFFMKSQLIEKSKGFVLYIKEKVRIIKGKY